MKPIIGEDFEIDDEGYLTMSGIPYGKRVRDITESDILDKKLCRKNNFTMIYEINLSPQMKAEGDHGTIYLTKSPSCGYQLFVEDLNNGTIHKTKKAYGINTQALKSTKAKRFFRG